LTKTYPFGTVFYPFSGNRIGRSLMKYIVLFLLIVFTGCSATTKMKASEPHPVVASSQFKHSLNNSLRVSFQAKVDMSGKPHRLVLCVSRQFPRRYMQDEVVDDSAEIMYAFGALRIEASLNKQGDYPLRRYPAHIVLFHRRKDLTKQVLAQWWITETEVFTSQPPHLMHPHLNVQSCERYINAQ